MKNFNSKKKIRISYTKRNNEWKNAFYPGKIPICSKESLLGLKRTQSESLYRFNSFNNSNSNLPILQQSEIADEDSELYALWDDLGVEAHYRRVFEFHLKTLSNEEKKEFLEYEKTSLNRIKENLCKLAKAIAERDKAIEGLKKIDKVVSSYNNAKLDDLLIADIIQSIKAIRFHSINVVNFMTKIREIMSYHQMKGKIDIHKINITNLLRNSKKCCTFVTVIQDVTDIQDILKGLKAEIVDLKQMVSDQGSEISRLKRLCTQKDARIAKLENENKSIKNRLSKYEKDDTPEKDSHNSSIPLDGDSEDNVNTESCHDRRNKHNRR